MALLAAAVGVGFLNFVLPHLHLLFMNLTRTLISGTTLLVLAKIITAKRTRVLFWNMLKSVSRLIAKTYAELDPIGIMRNTLADMRDQYRNLDKQAGIVRGVMETLNELMEKSARQMKESLGLLKQAQKRQMTSQLVLQSRRAGRRKDNIITFQELHHKLELILRVLIKYMEAAKVHIDDLEDDIMVQEQKRKGMRAASSAIRSARSIFVTDQQTELFNLATEALAEDYGRKLGEIKHFVEISQGMVDGIDLRNGKLEEEALELLEQWESDPSSFAIPGMEKQRLIAVSNDPNEVLDIDSTQPDVRSMPTASGSKDQKWDEFLE
ncbi:MAG: hypothetical protein ABIB97_05765 [Patescibacteria group bacterium]